MGADREEEGAGGQGGVVLGDLLARLGRHPAERLAEGGAAGREDGLEMVVEVGVVGQYGDRGGGAGLGPVVLGQVHDQSLAGPARMDEQHAQGLAVGHGRREAGEVPDAAQRLVADRLVGERVGGASLGEQQGAGSVIDGFGGVSGHVGSSSERWSGWVVRAHFELPGQRWNGLVLGHAHTLDVSRVSRR